MNSKKFSETMNEIDDKYVDEAINYQKKHKSQSWVKWASIVACFCIIVGTVFVTTQKPTNSDVKGYYAYESQQLIVELVAWQGEGFTATVVDERNNSIFPFYPQLLVFFEENTEIVLYDGTTFDYTPSEQNTEAIGWEVGQLVLVEFFNWEEYENNKGFFNKIYANYVEVISDIDDN